jgi:hypothetical protein
VTDDNPNRVASTERADRMNPGPLAPVTGREANGAGLRPHCPVDAAPRTSLRRSQQNHQRAPEFRIGRSTPRRAIRPTKLPPRAQRTSRQRAHVSSGTYGALSPRRQPSSPFHAFLRRRLTALLADRTGSASSASGLIRPPHSLSISNARFANAPLASLLAPDSTGAAFAPVL